MWTRRAAAGAWRHYFGVPLDAEVTIPLRLIEAAFPKPSAEFREEGFPPALIVVNPVDPLRDEGIALATGLVDAGCIAEMYMFAGTFHGSLSMPGSVTWGEIQLLIDRFVKENSVAR